MDITLNQIRYFCTLAAAGNFGRAAERLNMSQPPLSRQIAALERDLGTVLFERTPKGVELTAAGRQFLGDAAGILRLVSQARRNASAAGRGEVGELTMGFTMCAAYSVVPALAKRYRKAFPAVALHVRELMPSALERDLRDGAVDIAISFPGAETARFATRTLLSEPLSLVLPERHRLARARRVKMEDLAEERFLIVPRQQAPSLHDTIVGRCREAGFTPIIGLEVYLQQTIVNFVAEGLGIALVPASMRRSQIEGAVFRPVERPPAIEQILFWSPENSNPCIAGFLSCCDGLDRQAAG
ncbi:LysR family transcriptional regulator [Labrys monachus]|uniref:DNA-binding transcriptional LysR family regulator n=1 Tax=Labrys monachus TaxID=217067 RepID=A0ABU0F7I9_9HYPH|nr:LysR family transcriptional regulator [Labrys monachus]MDQ0390577.1 DNA-binding transcriptional LysR family regulator [Labrys monachus]